MNEHYIDEQGIKTTLKEFVKKAIETLQDKPVGDRAVKFADDITDIRHLGHAAPLESICPLPVLYRYGYSGFAGCILYIEKTLLKRDLIPVNTKGYLIVFKERVKK